MELDWSVGQIMGELKKQGVDNNTLVLFISDNGPWLNYGDYAGSSGGFREGKSTTYEGGLRVPFLVRWPGVVPAGRVSNKLLTAMDILPTVAKLCGARKNSLEAVREGEWKLVFAHPGRTYEGFLQVRLKTDLNKVNLPDGTDRNDG